MRFAGLLHGAVFSFGAPAQPVTPAATRTERSTKPFTRNVLVTVGQRLLGIGDVDKAALVLSLQGADRPIHHANHFVDRQAGLNLQLRVLIDGPLDVLGLADLLTCLLECLCSGLNGLLRAGD